MKIEPPSVLRAGGRRRARPLRTWLSAAALASSLPTSIASADTSDTPFFGDHTLKGHTFVNPILQPTGFVTTHFGIRQGILVLQVPRALGPLKLTMSSLQQFFDGGIRFSDSVGIYATGAGEVSTGTDAQSIILLGSTFSTSAEVGFIVRLARLEKTGTQISMRAGGGAGTGRVMDVQGLVGALFSGNDRTLNQVLNGKIAPYIFRPQSTFTLAGSLLAAQTLTPNFSLQASFEVRRISTTESPLDPATGVRVDETSKETSLDAAVALAADGAASGFPLAAVVEYNIAAGRTDGEGAWSDLQHVIALGIYYTGRRNLQVGVGGLTFLGLKPFPALDEQGNPARSGAPSAFGGQFILRYVW
jgi:hypothetical protein